MDAAQVELCQRLATTLKDLEDLYAQLLEVLNEEKNHLILAEIQQLQVRNEQKENLLKKIALTDLVRQQLAKEISVLFKMKNPTPRLREIATLVTEPHKSLFYGSYENLQKLFDVTAQVNKQNEELAFGALRVLNGAMNEIKETIAGKQVYGGRGQYKVGPETTGHFVRKEA